MREFHWRRRCRAPIMFGRMKRETPDQKWNRLQSRVQEGITKAYSNPERKGCGGADAILELAKRAAAFDETIEHDSQWSHVTHCSPCYEQYLQAFKNCRREKSRPRAR